MSAYSIDAYLANKAFFKVLVQHADRNEGIDITGTSFKEMMAAIASDKTLE
jgi:hypothetical protein